MKFRNLVYLCLAAVLGFSCELLEAGPATSREIVTLRLGGCGGVYFYAPTGELWVEVEKQDVRPTRK